MSVALPLIGEKDMVRVTDAIHRLAEGGSNSVGTFALATGGATVTTVTAVTCSPSRYVWIQALDAAAAAVVGSATGAFTTAGDKQFTVTHAANSTAGIDFAFVVFG